MSMIGKFFQVTDNELEEYLANSLLFEKRIDAEDSDEGSNVCDIDKSWDALSFLLTGFGPSELKKAEAPLSWVIFGAQILDENQDLGYGPAGYLTSDQVSDLNNALNRIPISQLKENYDPAKMNELGIYPNFWENNEDEIDYLINHFIKLKEFYKISSLNGQAVITYLS